MADLIAQVQKLAELIGPNVYLQAAIIAAARETGAVVTAENNVIFGGLGSAVAELLVENLPLPMQRIGVQDTFAESGPYVDLLDK